MVLKKRLATKLSFVDFFHNFEIKVNTSENVRSSYYYILKKKRIKRTNNENDKSIT